MMPSVSPGSTSKERSFTAQKSPSSSSRSLLPRPISLLAPAEIRSRRLSCSCPRWNFFHTRSKSSLDSLTSGWCDASDELREAALGAVEDERGDDQAPESP